MAAADALSIWLSLSTSKCPIPNVPVISQVRQVPPDGVQDQG